MRFGAPATAARSRAQLVRVLRVDPELGGALDGPRLAEAAERLIAAVVAPRGGALADSALTVAGTEGLGLLMLEGVIAREVLLSDNVSVEFLGAGDLLQESRPDDPGRLLRSQVRWTIVEPARFAVLDARFARAAAEYPEVALVLMNRLVQRSHRLAVTQAITQLNGVDRRVLTLLWHLAERWGHISSSGVEVPLRAPHRMLAQAVGARRPAGAQRAQPASGRRVGPARRSRRAAERRGPPGDRAAPPAPCPPRSARAVRVTVGRAWHHPRPPDPRRGGVGLAVRLAVRRAAPDRTS
jgi:CRP-like cAMP-binding protein